MKTIDRCRVCGSSSLKSVIKVPNACYTGIFPSPSEVVERSDMTLVLCQDEDCGLLQLQEIFDPEKMYGDNYGYRSGLNENMIKHLTEHATSISEMFPNGGNLLDIGCNDGTFLSALPNGHWEKFGIDPSSKKFAQFIGSDVSYLTDFFNAQNFQKLTDQKMDVVTSFSIFYDLEDPVRFASDVKSILAKNGVWILEQSYLGAMLRTNSIDTICHEHISYYSLKALKRILKEASLKILSVSTNNVNGGSFVLVAGHSDREYLGISNIQSVQEFENAEKELRLFKQETYDNFLKNLDQNCAKAENYLIELENSGKKIYGLGASTKGNTFLQWRTSISSKIISIGEVNLEKVGKVTPGTQIPIVNEDSILLDPDGVYVVFPWHFHEFFRESPKYKGKKLIFILPKLEVIQR